MFELSAHPIKIKAINPRAEHHGDEVKAMYDLKIAAFVEGFDIIPFHPELRSMLFKVNDDPDLSDKEPLSKLRFPLMGPVKWKYETVGYTARLIWGMDTLIEVEDCRLHKFVFTPKETGGIVLVEFMLSTHIKPIWVGKLCELIKQEVQLTLRAPEDKQGKIAA